jgi:hypothetical protein
MDLNASNLLSTLLISCLGMGFFLYGKKAGRLYPLLAGIAMSIYPFFIASCITLWVLTGAICAVLYVLRET